MKPSSLIFASCHELYSPTAISPFDCGGVSGRCACGWRQGLYLWADSFPYHRPFFRSWYAGFPVVAALPYIVLHGMYQGRRHETVSYCPSPQSRLGVLNDGSLVRSASSPVDLAILPAVWTETTGWRRTTHQVIDPSPNRLLPCHVFLGIKLRISFVEHPFRD